MVGSKPADLPTRVRIALAQRLLRKGRTVVLLADDAGCGGQPAFSRAFNRETRMGPSTSVRSLSADASVAVPPEPCTDSRRVTGSAAKSHSRECEPRRGPRPYCNASSARRLATARSTKLRTLADP
ncbi:MAG: Helix-turn-helix domain protein [Candidatus Accumulibacter adjunctus]|uniref:Helix-turn-helix domain protein n=1 Tax=Candidatus Accumulibacter adjunctus TaxID=1454001 RepID=A0A011NQF5_9PROT|nr:MAG: Helix-turn-helix domain protein [Candidatus Accumulibacter adjunctus]